MATTVNNYLKNVMKSVAYAAADVSDSYMPSMKEFTSTNKEFATATYSALKNPSQFVKKQVQAIQESKVYKALDYGTRNFFEDLRTGNFYNKARKDRDELALSGLDANWDDLSEFGIDDDWEKKLDSSSSSKVNDEITAGDLKVVESIEGSNAALASATVNAVITSSNNQIKNGRANTAMLYAQNEKLFGGLHKDITVLGSTMQQMYKLQSASLQNIDKNISSFFTQESKLSAERNAILKEMLELQRNVYKSAADREKEAASKKKSNRIRWDDINVNGVVDINAYFGAVKKNINSQLATLMPAGFGEDSNMLANLMVSPLEGAMKYVVNGVIPATVKAAAKELDASVSGIFGNVIGRLGNARAKNEGGLLGTLAKFFGISTSVNRSIDTSRYEKGPIPFDGITRKAIIDVIPTHLRRIEAAITGRPEEMFDYKAGRWVKVSSVLKQYDDIKKNAIKRGTQEIREAMNPGVQAVRRGIMDRSDRDSWDKAIEEFQEFYYNNNGYFNSKVSASKNGISSAEYPNLYKHYNKIKTIYSDFDRIESKDKNGKTITRHTRNSVRIRGAANALDAKEYEERLYREIESDVSNALNSVFGLDTKTIDKHGKYANGKFEAYNVLSNSKDKLGNTVFDYLQNINAELTLIREGGIYGGGAGFIGPIAKPRSIEDVKKELNKIKTNSSSKDTAERERIAKSALDAIKSGKAIDLRDLSVDEQNYLLQLSTMLSNNAINEYKSEIEGYNENEISKYIDKHFIKTNIKSQKDIQEAIKKAEKSGKNTNEVMDAKEETFFRKIMNRIGTGESILGGIVGASSEAFTNLLYTADRAIYEMMYKAEIKDEDKKTYNGFMDAMVGKMTDKFKVIGDQFKKDIIDPFKEKLGIDKDFNDRFKESLINTGSKLWTSFKDANASVYGPAWHEAQAMLGIAKKNINREHDKAVMKKFKSSDAATSKITNKNFNRAISYGTKDWYNDSIFGIENSEEAKETRRIRALAIRQGGEALAIWCERNGFTGTLDEKKVRLGSEFGLPSAALARIKTNEDANMVFAKQFRHYARGTTGKPFAGLTTLTKGEVLIPANAFGTVVPKTGVYNITRPTHIMNTEDAYDLGLIDGPRVSVQQALGKEKLAAKSAGFNIAHHDKGTMKVTKNGTTVDSKDILSEAKKYIPEAASGGLIGGILSMVLGLAGGPLVGAAIGAGGSILANSDKLKEKLFGKIGDDGKRDGSGFISKSVMKAFNKYFPDMAKYGLAGIIPGLLTPLGPIGGLLVGGAFGYLKNNERFTNKYFGEEGALHIKSKEKKIIQDMLPGAAKGAVAGALATLLVPTPFGLLGNAAIGAGLGMMTTTEDFKNFVLGTEVDGERMGGIVGAFKDAMEPFTKALKDSGTKLIDAFDNNLIKPLANFINPAIHALPIALGTPFRLLSNMVDKLGSKIGKTVETWAKRSFAAPFNFAGRLVKGGANLISGVTKLPGWVLNKTGDRLSRYNIRHGDLMNMTQAEAVDFMDSNGWGGDVSSMLRTSAKIGSGLKDAMSKEQAELLVKGLKTVDKNAYEARSDFGKKKRNLNDLLTTYKFADGKKLSNKQVDAILSAARTKDYSSISAILQNRAGLSMGEIDKFMEEGGLRKAVSDIAEADYVQKNAGKFSSKADKNKMNSLLKDLGITDIDVTNKKDRARAISLIKDQLLHLEANPEENKLELENNKDTKRTADTVEQILELLTGIASGDEAKKKEVVDKVNESINRGKHEAAKKADDRVTKALNSMTADEAEAVENTDALTTKKNMKVADLGSRIINNSKGISGTANALKVFSHDKIEEIKEQFTNEAIIHISNITNSTYLNNLINALNNKYINSVLKNSGWLITEKTVNSLEGFTSDKNELSKKCELLTQIYNKSDGKSIYSNFESLEDMNTKLDSEAMWKLRERYDVKYTDKSASGVNTAVRRATTVGRALGKGAGWLIGKTLGLAGKTIATPFKVGAWGIKEIDNAVHGIRHDWQYKMTSDYKPEQASEEQPAQNGLGTFLLGAGKKVLGGIKSLFGRKKDKEDQSTGGLLGGLLGLGHGLFNKSKINPVGNMDELDKPNDGKEHAQIDGEFIRIERKSDGSIEPDTSDSKTKEVLNKLSLKEKMLQKVQEAQLKASEVIKNNFDTSKVKGSKGGKLGWLGLLLTTGYLWETGLIGKLFNGFVKPLWTDHIKPWINEKAIPWISDKWNNNIKPWLIDTAIPTLGNIFKTAVVGLAKMLPELIWAGVKGLLNIGDAATGNKYNAGGSTIVLPDELVTSKGSNYVTGMTDENGKTLTAQDILNGNYNKIYNTQGVEGTVNEDGSITFKDQSKTGASYANTVIGGGIRGFLRSMGSGRTGLLAKGALKTNKVVSKIPLIGKPLAALTTALSGPVAVGEKLGVKASGGWKGLVGNVVDNTVDKMLVKDGITKGTAAYDIAKTILESGDGSKLSNLMQKTANVADAGVLATTKNGISSVINKFKDKIVGNAGKVASEAAEDVAEKGIKDVAKATAKGADGLLPKLLTKAKEFIKGLFENSKVASKLKDVAEALGSKAPAKWISKFKNSIDDIFSEALEKGIKKAGADTCKKVLSKAFAIIFAVTDFLTGMDKAESILGVKETSIIEEVVAGLINAICNFLIIPSIFPGTDWIARKIYGAIDDDFEERQAEADKEYEDYIKETGATYTKEEYLKRKNSFTGKVGGWFSDRWSDFTGLFKKKSGSGTSKYGKGYSKQIDPSIAGIRFNSSYDNEYQTIGDSGCGPAAAVNALESIYGRGNRVVSAAKFALSRGYKEANGGTKPGFFTDYFNRNGLGSQTSYNKSVIARNINNGLPTVIMGSDARGTSSYSPFGRNPHYVTVTGVDGRGNAIVQDPESRYDNQLYPLSSLMKNTTLGVSAFGRSKWGRGTEEQIWWYLKQLGLTDAGAAGLMANLFAESGLRFNNLQNTYEKRLGSDADYTAKVDNGSYTNFANDSAGYGLAQWTSSGRKAGLYNLAKNKGRSIADPETQLGWLATELSTSYKDVLNVLKTTNDLLEASNIVLTKFERPKDQGASVKSTRYKYAQKYLGMFTNSSGEPITGAIMPDTSSTIDGSTTNTTSNNNNIFSILSNGLSNVLANSKAGQTLNAFTGGISNIANALLGGTTTASTTASSSTANNSYISNTYSGNISNAAARMVEIATRELGTQENPLGSNNIKYNDWYYGSNRKEPWCAAFVSWVANQAGIPENIIPKHSYTPDGYNFLRSNGGEIAKAQAIPGDIAYFYRPSKGRIGHTGIVTGRNGNDIITIEGNSSDKVSQRVYGPSNNANEYNNLFITRPKYGSGTSSKPLSRYGQFKNSIYGNGSKFVFEEETDFNDTGIRVKNNSTPNTGRGTVRYGMAGATDYSGLINVIITILTHIAENTDKLNLAVNILNGKLGSDITPTDVSNATKGGQSLKSKLSSALSGIIPSVSKFNTYADGVGDSFTNAIMVAMNNVASE